MRHGVLRREFEARGTLRVEVIDRAGDVDLRAHEERKVVVEMVYELRGWGRSAEERERELAANPPVTFTNGILRVGPAPEGLAMDYTLFLPPEAAVEVEVEAGDVTAQGLANTLRISTGSGDVSLRGISGTTNVLCGNGDVNLQEVFGAISIRTGSGDIAGQNVKGALDLETGSGDVNLTDVEGELRIFTESGDVRVEGRLEEETWRIRTGSGDVILGLPEGTNAELLLRTKFGDVECDLPLEAQERGEGHLVGRLGATPKARILVETESGDIQLTQA